MVGRQGFEPWTPGLKVVLNIAESAVSVNNLKILNDFIRDRAARGLSPNTIRFYTEKLTYLNNRIDDQSLLYLTRVDIQQILMSLPCNPGGKQAYLRAFRAFYSWAEDTELIPKNPCSKVKIKVPKPIRHAVNLTDLPKLLATCESVRDRLILSMLADTGLRLSELASVGTGDVAVHANTIILWGKGAKQRIVRYGPHTASLLTEYLGELPVPGATLFGLKPRGISILLYRLGKATGIKCNAHSFRRTFATESVRNGMNLFYVQSLLGHSSLTMTRIYAEQVNSEDAIKAYKPIVR